MIVILCDSYQDAQIAFGMFLDLLRTYEEYSIVNIRTHCCAVQTDDDLTYIFTDYHYEGVFARMNVVDFIDKDQFFEGLDEFYYDYY